jgi:hypothetical protein
LRPFVVASDEVLVARVATIRKKVKRPNLAILKIDTVFCGEAASFPRDDNCESFCEQALPVPIYASERLADARQVANHRDT